MASEPKRIWLSRDAEGAGDTDFVFQWHAPPAHDPTDGWSAGNGCPDAEFYLDGGRSDCLTSWGVVPSLGQCVPIDLVPGEPITAEEDE